jgi:hypothetical protein
MIVLQTNNMELISTHIKTSEAYKPYMVERAENQGEA